MPLLKSLVLALSVCAAVHAPVLAKGSPVPTTPSASSTAYMTRTVMTWMLAYELSPGIGHVDDIASEDECESTWKSMASIARNPNLLKHKCIRVEKRAR